MEETGWWIYLKKVARTEDGLTIAEAAGVTPPQVSRWKAGKNRPDADKLARFARSYGRPPVEALVAAGYLTEEEAAEVIEIHRGVDSLTDEELVAEVQRRMKGMRNALEAAAATGASTQGGQAQEGMSVSEQLKNRDGRKLSDIKGRKDPRVDRGPESDSGHDLPGSEVI